MKMHAGVEAVRYAPEAFLSRSPCECGCHEGKPRVARVSGIFLELPSNYQGSALVCRAIRPPGAGSHR